MSLRLASEPTGVVRELRRRVVNPPLPRDKCAFPGDEADGALHLAVRCPAGTIVAVGSVLPQPPPGTAPAAPWRVRGMVVEPGWRGRGLGSWLLDGLLGHAARLGGRLAWCTALYPERGFYARHGFAVVGGAVVLPRLGTQVQMRRALQPADAGTRPLPDAATAAPTPPAARHADRPPTTRGRWDGDRCLPGCPAPGGSDGCDGRGPAR